MVQRRRFVTMAVLAAGLLVTACGGGDDESAATTVPETTEAADPTTTTTIPPTTTEAPTTTAAPTTTEAPTTTAAPTTTEAPLTAADLDLGAAAVGPVGFGTGADAAIAVIMPVLGTPTRDDSHEYPTALEGGGGWTDAEEGVFAFQFLRRTCFDNGLCLSFGGAAPAELQLVGYDYGSAETPVEPALTTVNGVPLGARWSDHLDAMTANEGGCYSQGSGESGGALLLLMSDGDPFLVIDPVTGEGTNQVPDPSMVTVYQIFAGDNPGYLYGDC